MANSWGEYSSWLDDSLLLQDGKWNFEESYVDDSYSGGVAEGENLAQSKGLDGPISHERAIKVPLLPIYGREISRSTIQQDYLTINERIDKNHDLYRIRSSGIGGIESQRTPMFFDDYTEPSARCLISSLGREIDVEEELTRGRSYNQSSFRAMYSVSVHVEVAVDDEDEVEGRVDNDLTEELTSLVETGFMYI
jgi:hypothetical protein